MRLSSLGHILTGLPAVLAAIVASCLFVMPAIASTPSASVGSTAPRSAQNRQGCPSILDRTLPRLQDDVPQDLCRYAGQVVLVVNTASYCGYTNQYEGLEALHKRFQASGFTIMGFPSNDFAQEPGTASQIAEFCFNTYGVKFPMFGKTSVAGPKANPLFLELGRSTGTPPGWNFYKYLIGRDGAVIAAFPSQVAPLDARLTRAVEQAVKAAAPPSTVSPARK